MIGQSCSLLFSCQLFDESVGDFSGCIPHALYHRGLWCMETIESVCTVVIEFAFSVPLNSGFFHSQRLRRATPHTSDNPVFAHLPPPFAESDTDFHSGEYTLSHCHQELNCQTFTIVLCFFATLFHSTAQLYDAVSEYDFQFTIILSSTSAQSWSISLSNIPLSSGCSTHCRFVQYNLFLF